MNNMKKLMAILLALAMTAGLVMPIAASTSVAAAEAETTKSVEYVDENGAIQTVTATKVVDEAIYAGDFWSTGWYYAEGNTSLEGISWTAHGDVKLILCDGATLTRTSIYSINIENGARLTIYGQSAQTGKLVACITGNGTLTINGGVVEASGTEEETRSYGIDVENVIVNGGQVNSNAPIAASYGISGSVTFNGGTLIAKAQSTMGKVAAFSAAPTLPTTAYYWRTNASGNFTKYDGTNGAYIHNSSNAYVELTTQPSGGGYISYMDWDDTNKKLTPAFIKESECTVVTSSSTGVAWGDWEDLTKEMWYVVKDNVTLTGGNPYGMHIQGNVHLILCDGATLTVENSGGYYVYIDELYSLTIYGQSGQSGKLEVVPNNMYDIGIQCRGALTINGGVIEVDATEKSYCVEKNGLKLNNGTIKLSGQAFYFGTLTLPATYWWRTAADGIYKTQTAYTDSALTGTYFEVTTAKPADSLLDRVGYLDWDSTKNKLKTELSYCYDAIKVTGSTTTLGEEGKTKWYYVEGDVTVNGQISAFGDVHLILKDGATLTAEGGVVVKDESPLDEYNSRLTVYGQTAQTGKLVAKGNTGNGVSTGIYIDSYGDLTINGGVIEATGSDAAEGQTVTASYGIYGSYLVINSGKVTATGGTAEPYNEQYNETYSGGINVWELYINGGNVTATGGTATGANGESYGIQADLEVTGGTVVAKNANGKAVVFPQNATLTLPTTTFWWRTSDAAGTKYKTQNTYADTALSGNYFELTTARPEAAKIDADTPVSYLDWDSTTEALVEMKDDNACTEYTLVKSGDDVTWRAGWYVANGNVTIDGDVIIDGDVHLILCDGATLTVNGCVDAAVVDDRDTLSVYGQSTGDAAGKMTVQGNTFDFADDGYTWSYGLSLDELCVYGGDVTVSGQDVSVEDKNAYSYGVNTYEVTVYGGKLTATGGKAEAEDEDTYAYSVGIYAEDDLSIYGGVVKATGGDATADYEARSYGIYAYSDMTIENGEVNATSGKATGYYAYSYGIYVDDDMIVTDAEITATGGDAEAEGEYADAYSYGIYVGEYLTIEGGTITATGGDVVAGDDAYSYGIYAYDDLTIEGEDTTVSATGGDATGYYVYSYGIYADYDLTVEGEDTTVSATGGKATGYYVYSYGIYVDDDMTITDAEITAIGGNTTSGDDAKSYGIYVCCGNTSIEEATVTAKSGDATGEDDAYSYGLYNSEGSIYMHKAVVNATGGDAVVSGDASDDARSRGIYACDSITIEDSTVTAKSGDADSDDDAKSYAIYADDVTIEDSTVSATSGKATGLDTVKSRGIYAYYSMTVDNSKVTATAGKAEGAIGNAYSQGIYVDDNLTIKGGTITATGGDAVAEGESGNAYSHGLWVDENMTVEGGTVIAQSDATTGGKALIINGNFTLPTTYWWRTLPCADFTAGSTTGYVKNGQNAYAEITADADATQVNPDAHTFGSWVDELPATCRSTGTAGHKDCSVCGGHFDSDGAPITDLTLAVDPNKHAGTPIWDSSAEAHWQYYSCCPDAKTAAAAHTFSDEGICICGRKQYAVTWNFNGGKLGEQTSQIDKLAAGAAITAPETPTMANTAEFTYTFDGWYTAAEGGDRVTDFGTVSGNVTYYAHWRVQRNDADAPAKSPNTGDTTAALCLALSLFSLAGAALLLCGKKRKLMEKL